MPRNPEQEHNFLNSGTVRILAFSGLMTCVTIAFAGDRISSSNSLGSEAAKPVPTNEFIVSGSCETVNDSDINPEKHFLLSLRQKNPRNLSSDMTFSVSTSRDVTFDKASDLGAINGYKDAPLVSQKRDLGTIKPENIFARVIGYFGSFVSSRPWLDSFRSQLFSEVITRPC